MRRFIEVLRETIRDREVFSIQEAVAIAGTDAAGKSRRDSRLAVRLLLHRLARAGALIRCCRGTYAFGPAYRRGAVEIRAIACRMKRPAYVTMESALDYHGLIPERIHMVQCVTPTRAGLFRTPFGTVRYHVLRDFSYEDVQSVESGGMEMLIANPAKAVRDIALRQRHGWHSPGELMEDLRLTFDGASSEKRFLRDLAGYRNVVFRFGRMKTRRNSAPKPTPTRRRETRR